MIEETIRNKQQNPENSFDEAQDQKCYETSEEADNGLQDFALHDSGENST